jgi:hypothetical protein
VYVTRTLGLALDGSQLLAAEHRDRTELRSWVCAPNDADPAGATQSDRHHRARL